MPPVRSLLKRISYVRETVDKETNKTTLIEREGRVPDEPHFIKLYLDGIMLYADCPSWQNKVLHALLKRVEYKTNELNLPSGQKKRIIEELSISMSSLNNAIGTFVKKKLLIRTGKGVFLANPHLFGNGQWSYIRKLRLTVDFSAEGITMKGDVEREESATEGEGDAPTPITMKQDVDLFEKSVVAKIDDPTPTTPPKPKRTVEHRNPQLEVFEGTLNSAFLPGFTPQQIEQLRMILEKNIVPASIAGMFASSIFSLYQLVNTVSL